MAAEGRCCAKETGMSKTTPRTPLARAAWKVKEFREAVPVSHAQFYEWINSGLVPSVKIGGTRYITESPAAFLQRRQQEQA